MLIDALAFPATSSLPLYVPVTVVPGTVTVVDESAKELFGFDPSESAAETGFPLLSTYWPATMMLPLASRPTTETPKVAGKSARSDEGIGVMLTLASTGLSVRLTELRPLAATIEIGVLPAPSTLAPTGTVPLAGMICV